MSDRPRRNAEEVYEASARAVLKDVMSWLKCELVGEERDEEEAEVLKQLVEAMLSSLNLDGYELARLLDRHHSWDPDESLVDILSGLEGRVYGAHKKAVQAWVAAQGLTLEFAAGTRVTSEGFRRAGSRNPGTVVGHRPETAEYLIQFDGEQYSAAYRDKDGTLHHSGHVVARERVQILEAAAVPAEKEQV